MPDPTPRVSDWFDSEGKPTTAFVRYLEKDDIEFGQWAIEYPTNKTYPEFVRFEYPAKIIRTTAQLQSGTCTLSWQLDGETLPGGNHSVTASFGEIARDTKANKGGSLVPIVSASSTPLGLVVRAVWRRI